MNHSDPISKKISYNILQQKLGRFFSKVNNVFDFLARTAWPIIDVLFRAWIAKQLLTAGLLMIVSWDTSVWLAGHEYPVPGLDPKLEALLSIIVHLGAGISLLVGFGTRIGALAVLVLALMTQIFYVKLDVNLFWIVLMTGYVLRGAGAISFDNLLAQGLGRSPLPFATTIIAFFEYTGSLFSDIYLLSLRLWLMLTFISQFAMNTLSTKIPSISSWLPLHSAAFFFNHSSILFAALIGFGLATRFSAIVGIGIIFYTLATAAKANYATYWMMVMAILFVSGPGRVSLDQVILNILKRRYPQLSGKPAFSLENLPHVVIIGAGFGGIACVKALSHVPVKITLVDRHNYHLFQPLLYQVATGNLSPGDIAVSIRSIFLNQFNAQVVLGNIIAIDKEKQLAFTEQQQISYDYLVIATGATHSYFGKDNWAPYAPGLKNIADATAVRSSILRALELAELATTKEEQQQLLNFIIVGGGPTGVELAGAIAELTHFGMEKDYRHFDPALANIILVQAAPRILPTFLPETSASAQQSLEKIGVKILTGSKVEQIDDDGVIVNGERIYSKSVLWAAGVTASPAAKWLSVEADPAGRVKVTANLSVPNYHNIFIIGDVAASNGWQGKPVPGLAPAAKQGGVYVAKLITAQVFNQSFTKAFNYTHRGSLATVGRKYAVAEFNLIRLSGVIAWWFWGLVHVSFLVGTRNRLSVLLNWIWSYLTFRANNLLITDSTSDNKPPLSKP